MYINDTNCAIINVGSVVVNVCVIIRPICPQCTVRIDTWSWRGIASSYMFTV